MASNHPNIDFESDSPDPILEWQDEAAAIIKDIQNNVKDVQISTKLESRKTEIYLNLTTLEDKTFCIRASSEGFQIVGFLYDTVDVNESSAAAYETPYALLNDISAGYVQSFGNDLTVALEKILVENKSKD